MPGIKLGLSNLVVVAALYLRGARSALGVNLLRILLVGVLFGNGVSLIYSICGGALSGAIMLALRRTGLFSLLTVSILGGIAHNVGQILAAVFLLGTTAVGWYLPILWFSGAISGAVIGGIGGILVARLRVMPDNGGAR